MAVKKKLMEFAWRLQQSQMIIGIVFWPLTLTGIFYPYVRERTNNFGLGQEAVIFGMLILFLIIALIIVLFGLAFDKMRFWKEQNIVAIERNPYGSYKFTARDVAVVRLLVMALKELPIKSKELKSEAEYFDRWLERVLEDDPMIKEELEDTRKWVKGGPKKSAPE